MVTVSLEGGVQPGKAIALPMTRLETVWLSSSVGEGEERVWVFGEWSVGLALFVAVTWIGATGTKGWDP
jgi:hypothetical protein